METNTAGKALILCSIGPVQEFIAQARKTRDLWFGSHLLSELGKVAAFTLLNKGANLIFPYIDSKIMDQDHEQWEKLNSPNRVMALVETSDPKSLALEVKEAVVNRWLEFASKAREQLGRNINPALWRRQVRDVIEFHAVWTIFREEADYAKVVEQTEELLAARKTLRDFKPNKPSHLYGEVKSSLDPGRECVLEQQHYSRYAIFGIKKKERLDAISLVKRLSFRIIDSPNARFPSVCDVAFSQLRRKIEREPSLMKLARDYQDRVWQMHPNLDKRSDADFDSRLFYLTHIKEMVEDMNMSKPEQEKVVMQINEELQYFYKKSGLKPSPYYAFMMCDGDHIGKALRTIKGMKQHQLFSESLSKFAKEARSIINTDIEDEGELIYAGGDDVMAYLPLHRCLDVADKLHESFKKRMKEVFSEDSILPTLSIGIAIVHMMEPMSEARRLAMAAEKQAKKRRNELAFYFQKRGGGEQMRFSISFDTKPVREIKKLQCYYRGQLISVSLVHAMQTLHSEYMKLFQDGLLLGDDAQRQTLLEQEVSRLIHKKKQEDASDELMKKVESFLHGEMRKGEGTPLNRLDQIIHQMLVAIHLEKAGDCTYEIPQDSTA